MQIRREEGKDSQKKKLNTCSERKQPEKVPVKAAKRKHSGNKKSIVLIVATNCAALVFPITQHYSNLYAMYIFNCK